MNGWTYEPLNQWMNAWMDGWMNEWTCLFSQLLLLWAPSYLGYFFSGPASSPVASTTQFFSRSCYNAFCNVQLPFCIAQEWTVLRNYLPRSCYNAFGNLQLQSRMAWASQHHWCSAAQPCQCILSQPVANLHSRSVASHRATFSQRRQCGLNHTNPALLPSPQFFTIFKSSSGYSLVHILPTSSSKSATRLQREANSWLNKSATPGATLPVKTRISRFYEWKLIREFTWWWHNPQSDLYFWLSHGIPPPYGNFLAHLKVGTASPFSRSISHSSWKAMSLQSEGNMRMFRK